MTHLCQGMLQARNLFGAVGALDGFASVQAENPHHRGDEDMELDQAKEDGGATAEQQRGEERGMGRDGQFETPKVRLISAGTKTQETGKIAPINSSPKTSR